MAASPAENRVSFRSKETIGFADAMYSITLIQVDTSFNGLEGSGSTQISAAARLACKSSSEMKPVNSTQPLSCSFQPDHANLAASLRCLLLRNENPNASNHIVNSATNEAGNRHRLVDLGCQRSIGWTCSFLSSGRSARPESFAFGSAHFLQRRYWRDSYSSAPFVFVYMIRS